MALFIHRNDADASTPHPGTPNTRDQRRPRDREALIRRAELVISHVLRGGVVLSALIILAGVVAFYFDYFTASGHLVNTAFPHTLSGVASGLAHGNPVAVIVLGLLVLLATPVARVAVSIIAFAVERDWRYVVITSIVLVILLVSFGLGRGGA